MNVNKILNIKLQVIWDHQKILKDTVNIMMFIKILNMLKQRKGKIKPLEYGWLNLMFWKIHQKYVTVKKIQQK